MAATIRDVLQAILGRRLANPGREFFNAAVESGSWTPTIEGQTTAGVGTYTTQVGQYLRLGPLVLVQYRVITTAHTGTGHSRIPNMPFAARNAGSGYFSGAVYSGAQAIAFALIAPATSQLYFYQANPASASNIPAGNGDWLGSICYATDDP